MLSDELSAISRFFTNRQKLTTIPRCGSQREEGIFMTEQKVLTMGEAAERLGVSRQAIWHAIQRESLIAIRHEHVVLITEEALTTYAAGRKKGGRPPKKEREKLHQQREKAREKVRKENAVVKAKYLKKSA